MSTAWHSGPLRDFAELVSTGPFGSMLHKADYVSDGVPLVNPINIVDERIVPDPEKQVSPDAVTRLSSYVLKPGDIVVGRRGEIGRCAVVGIAEAGWICGTGCFFIRPKSNLDSRFAASLIRSPSYRSKLESASTGTTMKNMSNASLVSLRISVPTLADQQRIVAILDEAFAGIATAKANAERNLQNARSIFLQRLRSAFDQRGAGWVDKTVSELAKHTLGKMLDKAKNRGAPQPYLRNLNVRWFEFDLADLREMKFLPEEFAKYTAIKGDVLVCEGGYPGRAAIWLRNEAVYFQKALHRARFHEGLHAPWFVYYLYVKDQIGELKANFSGTGIQHFTGEALAKFRVPVPPTEEVERLIASFDALKTETERLESIYTRKLNALDELKQSLLHQAFSGQL